MVKYEAYLGSEESARVRVDTNDYELYKRIVEFVNRILDEREVLKND